MNRAIPMWLSRVLGLPGSVSFRGFDSIVDTANTHTDDLHGLSDRARQGVFVGYRQFRSHRRYATPSITRSTLSIHQALGFPRSPIA